MRASCPSSAKYRGSSLTIGSTQETGLWFLQASLSIRTLRSRRTSWQESSCRSIYFPCCRTDPRSQRVRLWHTRRARRRREAHRESSRARDVREPGLLRPGPSLCPYSPKYVEGEFCEVRMQDR